MLKNFLLVGLGGCIGSMLRFLVYQFFKATHLPIATLFINILGSFIIGIVMAISIKHAPFNNNWKLFLATGICGGFTTFSAFSVENIQLLQDGKILLSMMYIAASIVLGIGAAWAGYKLAM